MFKLKFIGVYLICFFLIANLFANGKTDEKQSSDGSVSGAVTLTFMGWEASPLETESVKAGLTQFMAENPNIKVEYTPVPGEYAAKLLTMMAGDAAPDVFFIGGTDYRSFQKRDVLLNLTDYMAKDLDISEFLPMVQEKMLIGDQVFGVSSCNVSPIMYYNKELFDKAGLPYPPSDPEKAWKWDDFVNVAKKLTIKNGDRVSQFGVAGFEVAWGWVFTPLVYSNGGEVFNDDYSKVLLDTPEAKHVFTEIRKLKNEYGVAPEGTFVEQSGMSPSQMLQTGRVAMLVDGSWALQELAQMDFPLGIGVLPIFKEPATVGQAHLHAAWSKTKYPDEAWKLINFLSSEEYQLSNIRAGLWLPNRKYLYEKENLSKWINPEVYPENFENIVKYFTEYGRIFPGLKANKEVWDIINEEKDLFYAGGSEIDTTMSNITRRSNAILNK